MQYKTFLVPACKKSLTVNEAKVDPDKKKDKKEDAALIKKLKNEFNKRKKMDSVDNKFKANVHQIAAKLILQDPSLKDTEIFSHEEIVTASTAEKAKGCWECGGLNCLLKQNLCKEFKVKRQFIGGCKGKKATFGDLSKYGVTKNPSVGGNTTNIKPPAVIDYDSDSTAVM